jgi:hypothetical protein
MRGSRMTTTGDAIRQPPTAALPFSARHARLCLCTVLTLAALLDHAPIDKMIGSIGLIGGLAWF